MFPPLDRRAKVPHWGMGAPDPCDRRARLLARRLGSAALLGLAPLVVWTYLFLGAHELQHVGQANASACSLAPLAATLTGSGAPPAPPVLLPPATPVQANLPAIAAPLSASVRFIPNARAPPLLA